MGVHNTTGVNTLFIYAASLIATAAFMTFRRKVGRKFEQLSLIREGAWYAVDVSMVLNAMLRGAGVTNMARIQQCDPLMPTQLLFCRCSRVIVPMYITMSLSHGIYVTVLEGRCECSTANFTADPVCV